MSVPGQLYPPTHKHGANLKRAGIIAAVLLGVGLLVFAQVIRPNQHADVYEKRLSNAAAQLQDCFGALANTNNFRIFYAPDIELALKQQNVRDIQAAIRKCSAELGRFNTEAQTLPRLQLSGYSGNYRAAWTDKHKSLQVAGQSNDVLMQYGRLVDFLGQYFARLTPFVTYTSELNQISDTSLLAGRVAELEEQGNDLRRQAARVRALKPSVGFEPVIQPTAAMLDQAADGFELLASGHRQRNDGSVAQGFQEIESAVADYNSTVQNLPFSLLQTNYTVQQVAALPGKIESLRVTGAE